MKVEVARQILTAIMSGSLGAIVAWLLTADHGPKPPRFA